MEELVIFWAKRFSTIGNKPDFKTYMVMLHLKHGDKTKEILEEIKESPMHEVLREIDFDKTPQGKMYWDNLLSYCLTYNI